MHCIYRTKPLFMILVMVAKSLSIFNPVMVAIVISEHIQSKGH